MVIKRSKSHLALFAGLLCSTVTASAWGDFQLEFVEGVINLAGQSDRVNRDDCIDPPPMDPVCSDAAALEFFVEPDGSAQLGSTSTGGISSGADYDLGIDQQSEGQSAMLTFLGNAWASADIMGGTISASTSIDVDDEDLFTGDPIVMSLSDPVRFNVVTNSASGEASFEITDSDDQPLDLPPGASGMLDAGNYNISFFFGADLSLACPTGPNCTDSDSANLEFAMELFVPEPSGALLALWGFAVLGAARRARLG